MYAPMCVCVCVRSFMIAQTRRSWARTRMFGPSLWFLRIKRHIN